MRKRYIAMDVEGERALQSKNRVIDIAVEKKRGGERERAIGNERERSMSHIWQTIYRKIIKM